MGKKAFSRELATQNGLPVERHAATDDEVCKAKEVLASDFEKLSLIDKERLIFDIHGLPIRVPIEKDEFDTFLAEKLAAMEEELGKIDEEKKSAYEHALYLNCDYVEGKEFRRMFLLANDWDPASAADQLVVHFDVKRSLFGAGDVLGRVILQSDLSPEDMHCLENMCVQVLPCRDNMGRVVLFCAPGCSQPDYSDSVFRASLYCMQAVAREEGVSTDGYVMVNYNMGKYGRIFDLDSMEEFSNTMVDGSYLKTVVEHFCCDDPEIQKWANADRVFVDESLRHRFRSHFGSKEDVLFKLQTFGIPTDDFPINDNGTLQNEWHLKWIAAQRKKEAKITSQTYIVPKRFDVRFGRGSDTRVHSGNLRAQHMVEMQLDEYEQADKLGKTCIAEEIVASIRASYGRFLRWEDDESGWVEVDSDTARNKISHFFRRKRHRQSSERSSQEVKERLCNSASVQAVAKRQNHDESVECQVETSPTCKIRQAP